MESTTQAGRVANRLIVTAFVIAVMIIGKSFLVPLAWALLIGMASYPMLEKIEKRTHLPRSLINLIFLIFLLAVLLGTGFFFYVEISHIFTKMPGLTKTISERLAYFSGELKNMGLAIPDHVDRAVISAWVKENNAMLLRVLSGIGGNLWNIILIMFYMFFLLYYRELVFAFYAHRYPDPKRLVVMRNRFKLSLDIARNYIKGLVLLTLISAIMNYIVFLVFGLQFAMFFAVFLAVLNLVPLIGNPIGLVVIMLFAMLTKEGWITPVLIFVGLFAMNFLQDNVVRPWLMGDKMKLNAFAVFVSIIVGSLIWGVSGMILFIPITGIVKIILESRHETEHYAIFLSEIPGKAKRKNVQSENADR